MNFYNVTVYIKGRKNALGAIREYETEDYNEVYQIVQDKLLTHYTKDDIMKIDVWPLSEHSTQVQEYLRKINDNNSLLSVGKLE